MADVGMIVRIASGLAEQLLAHSVADAPLEACGLLLGTPGHIRVARPARNVAADPTRRFEIDPAMLLAEHRAARGDGMAILGHYHSHPDGSPQPSKRDAARALQNGQIWMIVTSAGLRAWAAAAHGTLHGRFSEIEMETV
jgi:proteasome lid subunit RPN8/RPN11